MAIIIPALPVTLCRIVVPDRHVATLTHFGHELTDPVAWGTVIWRFTLNGAPIPCYENFRQQIGHYVKPAPFVNPIKLKWLDIFEVIAFDPLGSGVEALARLQGFMFPVRETTQDGSYREYHTI